MDLQNIECQLAQAQMGRYLAGDSLPEDTLKQLEKHISNCENCQQAAQDKRISLEELLHKDGPAEPEAEPEPEPEPEPAVDLEVAELDDSTIMAALATAIPMPEPEPAPEAEPAPEPAAEPEVQVPDDPFADLMQAIPPEIEEFEAEEEAPAADLAEAIQALEPTPEPVAVAMQEPEPEAVAEPASGGRTITIHIPDLKSVLADKKRVLILGGGLVAVLGGMTFMMKSMKPAIGNKVLAVKDTNLHEEEEHTKEAHEKEEKPHAKADSKEPAHEEPKKEVEPKPHLEATMPKPAPKPAPPVESATEEFEVAKSDGTVAKAAVVPGKGVTKTPIKSTSPPKPEKPTVTKAAPAKRWTSKRRNSKPVRRKSKSAKKSFVKVYGVTVHD